LLYTAEGQPLIKRPWLKPCPARGGLLRSPFNNSPDWPGVKLPCPPINLELARWLGALNGAIWSLAERSQKPYLVIGTRRLELLTSSHVWIAGEDRNVTEPLLPSRQTAAGCEVMQVSPPVQTARAAASKKLNRHELCRSMTDDGAKSQTGLLHCLRRSAPFLCPPGPRSRGWRGLPNSTLDPPTKNPPKISPEKYFPRWNGRSLNAVAGCNRSTTSFSKAERASLLLGGR